MGTIISSMAVMARSSRALHPSRPRSSASSSSSSSCPRLRVGSYRPPRHLLVLRATVKEQQADEEEAMEARLEALKKAGTSKRRKASSSSSSSTSSSSSSSPASLPSNTILDYANEKVFLSSKPALGDLIVNILLGFTLLWLPLTLASIGRYAWLQYLVTDKRVAIKNSSSFGEPSRDIGYDQILEVVGIGRGLGLWGDIVIKLKQGKGENVELRAVPGDWQAVKQYIMEKKEEAEKEKEKEEEEERRGGKARPATEQGFGN